MLDKWKKGEMKGPSPGMFIPNVNLLIRNKTQSDICQEQCKRFEKEYTHAWTAIDKEQRHWERVLRDIHKVNTSSFDKNLHKINNPSLSSATTITTTAAGPRRRNPIPLRKYSLSKKHADSSATVLLARQMLQKRERLKSCQLRTMSAPCIATGFLDLLDSESSIPRAGTAPGYDAMHRKLGQSRLWPFHSPPPGPVGGSTGPTRRYTVSGTASVSGNAPGTHAHRSTRAGQGVDGSDNARQVTGDVHNLKRESNNGYENQATVEDGSVNDVTDDEIPQRTLGDTKTSEPPHTTRRSMTRRVGVICPPLLINVTCPSPTVSSTSLTSSQQWSKSPAECEEDRPLAGVHDSVMWSPASSPRVEDKPSQANDEGCVEEDNLSPNRRISQVTFNENVEVANYNEGQKRVKDGCTTGDAMVNTQSKTIKLKAAGSDSGASEAEEVVYRNTPTPYHKGFASIVRRHSTSLVRHSRKAMDCNKRSSQDGPVDIVSCESETNLPDAPRRPSESEAVSKATSYGGAHLQRRKSIRDLPTRRVSTTIASSRRFSTGTTEADANIGTRHVSRSWEGMRLLTTTLEAYHTELKDLVSGMSLKTPEADVQSGFVTSEKSQNNNDFDASDVRRPRYDSCGSVYSVGQAPVIISTNRLSMTEERARQRLPGMRLRKLLELQSQNRRKVEQLELEKERFKVFGCA